MVSSHNTTQSNNEPTLSAIDESVFSGEPVALVNVTLTRPMLSLDDEEIEVADLEPVSIEVLANEPTAPESATLSPQQLVQSWLDTWEGEDLEQYFASYDDDFVPRYHRSRSA